MKLGKHGTIGAVAIILSACTGISIAPEQIAQTDTQKIAKIRQDTLENKLSDEKVSWKTDTLQGTMFVLRSYERSDGVYCRRIVETKSAGFTSTINILSTWCRTGTGDQKWQYYQ